MHQSSYDREKSRERSRDRDRKYNGNRSPSEDTNYRKYAAKESKPRSKRVKFEEVADIKVFRKQDEPAAKGLSEEEIFKIKSEIEKEIAKSYDFNWEHYKHRDALSESNSMKEQKEKQKALCDKLMAAKETMSYFSPPALKKTFESLIEVGHDSQQREGHKLRIDQVLGCFFTHVSQIPNQPQFQILNTNTTSESRLIKFDKEIYNDVAFAATTKKNSDNAKPIKGILKLPNQPKNDRSRSEARTVDPQLIRLLKDMKINPSMYTKERTEQLLKPYKDSGELDFLMKNKEILEAELRNARGPSPGSLPKPIYSGSVSASRDSMDASGAQPIGGMPGSYGHTFVPKADKYRTVPCKYYHGPQGCSKIDNCTFIHDEKYAGQSVPMGSSSSGMSGGSRMGSYPPQNPPPYSTYPPMGPTLTTMQPNYYGHGQNIPYGANANPGYYSGASSGNSGYQSNGYQMNQPYAQLQGTNQLQPPNKYGPISTPYAQVPPAAKQPQYGAPGGPPQPQQPQQPQYMQNPQYGMPPGQGYNNPNYQYYIGNGQPPK